TLAMRWDGTAWNVVPTPNVGDSQNVLYGVSALSADSTWAVGRGEGDALIEHCDGTTWTIVPTPDGIYNLLYAVAEINAGDVWAGGIFNWPYGTITLRYADPCLALTPSPTGTLPTATTTNTPTNTSTITLTPTSITTIPACGLIWRTVSSPNSGSGDNQLNS